MEHEEETNTDIKNSFAYAKRFLQLDLAKIENFSSVCHDYYYLMQANKSKIPSLAKGLMALSQEVMTEFSKYEDCFLTFIYALGSYADAKTEKDYDDYLDHLDGVKCDEIETIVALITGELEDMGGAE